jgi:pyruvate ferredoxin oxidoreductase gamma subunit
MTNRLIVGIDATSIAMDVLGRPITNTAMLGALVAVSGVVSLSSVQKALRQSMDPSMAEKNCTLVAKAYELKKEDRFHGKTTGS